MNILVDFDDVLSDTFTELERREGPASDFSVEDLRVMLPGIDLEQYFTSIEFHLAIPPVPGAAEGVAWIVDQGHDVRYASARRPEVQEVSRDWLEKWGFPLIPLHCLGREGKKELLRSDPYELLIDDQMRYLKLASEQGKRAIALERRWNTGWDGDRISSWSEIQDVF
jgi:5'(3')-deoxyribonucleotidase